MACPAPGVRHMAKPSRRDALEDARGPHTQHSSCWELALGWVLSCHQEQSRRCVGWRPRWTPRVGLTGPAQRPAAHHSHQPPQGGQGFLAAQQGEKCPQVGHLRAVGSEAPPADLAGGADSMVVGLPARVPGTSCQGKRQPRGTWFCPCDPCRCLAPWDHAGPQGVQLGEAQLQAKMPTPGAS